MADIKLLLSGWNGSEFRVDVVDVTLKDRDQAEAIADNGDDFFCVYGSSALAALDLAVRQVENGSAEKHFDEVRRQWPDNGDDACGLCGVRRAAPGHTACSTCA
jgi:hypothetical protein